MIESLDDWQGGSIGIVHGFELVAWERRSMLLRIFDACHHPKFVHEQESLAFLHLDRHFGGVNRLFLD